MSNHSASRHDRFHGRIGSGEKICAHPGCDAAGEFRAPAFNGRRSGSDGPGDYQLLCLTHIREFNAGYDWFAGMDAEEIAAAQSPTYMWPHETRAFSPSASVDAPPKWQDFHDPLDAIGARFRRQKQERGAAMAGPQLSAEENRALKILGLSANADKKAVRKAYSEKLRLFHPDRNGGDRSKEQALQKVVESYQLLRKSAAFG